jgi:hypothetical protein
MHNLETKVRKKNQSPTFERADCLFLLALAKNRLPGRFLDRENRNHDVRTFRWLEDTRPSFRKKSNATWRTTGLNPPMEQIALQ